MKNRAHLFAMLLCAPWICYIVSAQDPRESEIRRLENLEREAVLKGDSMALFNNLWSPKMVINTPANVVGTVAGTKAMLRAGNLNYASFERTTEKITSRIWEDIHFLTTRVYNSSAYERLVNTFTCLPTDVLKSTLSCADTTIDIHENQEEIPKCNNDVCDPFRKIFIQELVHT